MSSSWCIYDNITQCNIDMKWLCCWHTAAAWIKTLDWDVRLHWRSEWVQTDSRWRAANGNSFLWGLILKYHWVKRGQVTGSGWGVAVKGKISGRHGREKRDSELFREAIWSLANSYAGIMFSALFAGPHFVCESVCGRERGRLKRIWKPIHSIGIIHHLP